MEQGGYDPTFFDRLALIEDRHFWFRARNRLILNISRRINGQLQLGSRILEVGCGTGNVLRTLENAYAGGLVFGMDLWQEGLRYAGRRTACPLVRADLSARPFGKPFQVIGLFDVLEHIPDDQQALRDLYSMLLPGGRLLVTVPAHQSLWSYFDEAAQHCRRYSLANLSAKLGSAGFQVEFSTEFMMCTLPLLWAVRKIMSLVKSQHAARDARQLADNEFNIIPGINSLMAWVTGIEASWVSRGHGLPFGSSILAVARR